jgi:hypothetical protein
LQDTLPQDEGELRVLAVELGLDPDGSVEDLTLRIQAHRATERTQTVEPPHAVPAALNVAATPGGVTVDVQEHMPKNKAKLQVLATELGLDDSGTVAELTARIEAHRATEKTPVEEQQGSAADAGNPGDGQ